MRKNEKNERKQEKRKIIKKQPKKIKMRQNRTKQDKICQNMTKQKLNKIPSHHATIIKSFIYPLPNQKPSIRQSQKKCQGKNKKINQNEQNQTKIDIFKMVILIIKKFFYFSERQLSNKKEKSILIK
jgi:hypothetical protein